MCVQKSIGISLRKPLKSFISHSLQQLSRSDGYRKYTVPHNEISHPTNLFAQHMKFVPIFILLSFQRESEFQLARERQFDSVFPSLFKQFRCTSVRALFSIILNLMNFFPKHHSPLHSFSPDTVYICSIHARSIYIFLMVFAFNSLFFANRFASPFRICQSCWKSDTKRSRHLTSNWNIFLDGNEGKKRNC